MLSKEGDIDKIFAGFCGLCLSAMRWWAHAREQFIRWIRDGAGWLAGIRNRIERDINVLESPVGIIDDLKIIRRSGIQRHKLDGTTRTAIAEIGWRRSSGSGPCHTFP